MILSLLTSHCTPPEHLQEEQILSGHPEPSVTPLSFISLSEESGSTVPQYHSIVEPQNTELGWVQVQI